MPQQIILCLADRFCQIKQPPVIHIRDTGYKPAGKRREIILKIHPLFIGVTEFNTGFIMGFNIKSIGKNKFVCQPCAGRTVQACTGAHRFKIGLAVVPCYAAFQFDVSAKLVVHGAMAVFLPCPQGIENENITQKGNNKKEVESIWFHHLRCGHP